MFCDGKFTDGTGEPLKSINPATGEVLAEVQTASATDVDRAVRAADRAFREVWGPMPGTERAKYVYRIARIIAERTRELAVLETLDNGKPIRESRDADIPTASAHFCSVTGARATGKTTTALQHVDTVVRLDRPEEAGAFAASPDATLAALPGRILLDE